ncbi:MAG: aminoacyl-tRNA hydrolase [Candidatus Colwellbacteria bacterium]|nr:aminoacyl-tRNA hydrolase [Candidatus Colwellbacteria bacterium]
MSQDWIHMYFVVNSSLDMGKGKIAGQVGHTTEKLIRRLEKNPTKNYSAWRTSGNAKIVLKAKEGDLEDLIKKYDKICEYVIDAGKTQITANSLTVVGFIPLTSEEVPPEIKKMKLM